jgi:hypothetical protein
VRSQAQTDTAVFFNSNSATMVGDALVRHLEALPTRDARGDCVAVRCDARCDERLADHVLAAQA